MGSRKLKRKKLKCKKLDKFHKLNLIKREESISFQSCNESDCEENLLEKNIINRLSQKNYPHHNTDQEGVSNVKYFSKIREDYFRHLQVVVSDNCVFYDSVVTEEMLESLALELEQNALLACLQVDIYKKSMKKIIGDIKKCTAEKQVHKDVKKLLPGSLEEQSVDISSTKIKVGFPVVETYNRIPTIASTRIDADVAASGSPWEHQSNFNSEPYYSIATNQEYSENQIDTHSHNWITNETYSTIPDQSEYWVNEAPQIKECNISVFENSKCVENQLSVAQNSFRDSPMKVNTSPDATGKNEEKPDPLLVSRNQLQKLVEQTLNETEKINRQKRDEQEKAYIAQILEGDDSLDDRLNDSLSDNENESKENIDESNLMDRLEKMREIFGVEEEEGQTDVVPEKQKQNNNINHVNNRSRRPTIWRYEKFIQLHKYSIIAAEMSFERRQDNQRLFLELFGEDSDEEHETEYSSTEKFRSSCTERISSWVVKYLMPFYHEKRILGRNVFKSLGHYVSDTIVDKIQYPDEWTVKYLVSKFFPPKKKYICEADVLNFQLD